MVAPLSSPAAPKVSDRRGSYHLHGPATAAYWLSPMERSQRVKQGVPAREVVTLADAMGLPRDQFMRVLGLARSGLATVEALIASGAGVTAWDDREAARNEAMALGADIGDEGVERYVDAVRRQVGLGQCGLHFGERNVAHEVGVQRPSPLSVGQHGDGDRPEIDPRHPVRHRGGTWCVHRATRHRTRNHDRRDDQPRSRKPSMHSDHPYSP